MGLTILNNSRYRQSCIKLDMKRHKRDTEQPGSRFGTTLGAGNREEVGNCTIHIFQYIGQLSRNKNIFYSNNHGRQLSMIIGFLQENQ